MRRSQLVVLVGTGAILAGGSYGLAAASGSSTATAARAPATAKAPAATQVQTTPTAPETVNVISATVGGRSEQILVDAKGLPLYTYVGDTSTVSRVSGALAALWPPLTAGTTSSSGVPGKLSLIADSAGQQVRYNGHFLYTFVNDTPDQVTGQGVQGFHVATPGLTTVAAKPASRPAAPANPYGY